MVMFVSCHHAWDSARCYSSSLMHIDAALVLSTNSDVCIMSSCMRQRVPDSLLNPAILED